MIERAGGVQPRHGQAIDEKDPEVQGAAQSNGAQQQGHSAHSGEDGSNAVGDGRPGPQPVIGVPDLLFAAGSGGEGEVWEVLNGGGERNGVAAHKKRSFQHAGYDVSFYCDHSITVPLRKINIKNDEI